MQQPTKQYAGSQQNSMQVANKTEAVNRPLFFVPIWRISPCHGNMIASHSSLKELINMVLTGIGPTGDCVLMINRGLSKSADSYTNCCPQGSRVIVITDREVFALHYAALAAFLTTTGRKVHPITIDGSEAAKNPDNIRAIYDQLSDIECGPDDVIIAFGGGSAIDLASFAAATYMGGIPLVLMPTSLAAMVDSSVNHRCCLNFRSARNVISTPSHPRAVLIDPDFMKSLSARQMANGYAQIIRYGMIADPKLIELMTIGTSDIQDMIGRAVNARLQTEKENPDFLGFGESFGDAIEGHFRFLKYQHGEALALGMLAVCPTEQMRELLQHFHLPQKLEGVTPDTIVRRIVKSFQVSSRSRFLVRVHDVGAPYSEPLELDRLEPRITELISVLI
jgi:3-dehydroquinate synthase